MARFFTHMVGEVVQVFWTALQGGEFITDAAAAAGTYRKQGTRWVIANGGVRPRRGRNLTGRFLSFAEREEIALARAAGESVRAIARRLGRSPSTISRELRRNAEAPGRYRATTAHAAVAAQNARTFIPNSFPSVPRGSSEGASTRRSDPRRSPGTIVDAPRASRAPPRRTARGNRERLPARLRSSLPTTSGQPLGGASAIEAGRFRSRSVNLRATATAGAPSSHVDPWQSRRYPVSTHGL